MQDVTIEFEDIDTQELDLIIAAAGDPHSPRFDDEDLTEPALLVTAAPPSAIADDDLRWIEWELNMATSVSQVEPDFPAAFDTGSPWADSLLEQLES